MPRQDVPYGGAICRLKERIAEIFDKLGEKLHTINGVPGDGDGNVKIVSGSSAVVITNDPTQNEISVALDNSQLPAAAVSSVNGQTGAVALTADDVPSDNGDVQTDLDNLAAADVTLQGNINAEALARQNADNTLQTNINTVSAGIPGAAAAAVAADPTVAYVASEINNKVDKITSGSSLKAYTHTGATQGEVSVVDGTSANSVGIRDANGRMQAADPASGATDKTLVTANWVSQTGDSAPNNLAHRVGAETWYGNKKFDSSTNTLLSNSTTNDNGDGVANKYKVILKVPLNVSYGPRNHILIGVTTRQRARSFDLLSLYIATSSPQDLTMVLRSNTAENYTYVLSYDTDYAYVSVLTYGTLSDGIQIIILGATMPMYNRFPPCDTSDIFATVPGTEIRRITP